MNKLKKILYILMLTCGILTGCSMGELDIPAAERLQQNGTDTVEDMLQETSSSDFSILFLDVGQADAALVSCDGEYMLIDGGNKEDSSKIYSVLKERNIDEIDIVVGSHGHEDHIGGIPGAYSYASAELTLCPVTDYDSEAFRDFKKYAELKGGGITVPSVGDEFSLGSAVVRILGVNERNETNNTSIVLKIEYGETSYLFTGDAERECEEILLETGQDLSCDVLKVGHHGSDTSSSYAFLREAMPEIAVISVGEGNLYGHPSDDTLSKLRDAEVEVYRTDLQGDILISSDGKNVTVKPVKQATAEEINKGGDSSQSEERPADTADMEASNDEYIANKNSLKFHRPSCESVGKMSEKNKLYLSESREEIIAQGFEPCGSCRP